jgi:hypothetical protein
MTAAALARARGNSRLEGWVSLEAAGARPRPSVIFSFGVCMAGLRRGDWVQVRPYQQILETLDRAGKLDGMPFMPEMAAYCGQKFQVGAVAHKTCDTVNKTGGRRLRNTVHLAGLLCDGSAHGGCEAGCLLFWKEAWLTRLPESTATPGGARPAGCTDEELRRSTAPNGNRGVETVYSCQATCLPEASQLLPWWDVRQYFADFATGNHRAADVAKTLFVAAIRHLQDLPFGYRVAVSIYRRVHRWVTGREDPHVRGSVPDGQNTPLETLGLRAGELVRVKALGQIACTLDSRNKNRGMSFDPEMAPFSGQTRRVARRVTRIVDERTGKLITMKNPCIVLEGVVCTAQYSERRLLCPRALPSFWRESWLERVPEPAQGAAAEEAPVRPVTSDLS